MKNKKTIRVVFMLLLIGILLVEVVSTKQVVNMEGSYQTNLVPQESQAIHTEPSIEIHESIIVGTDELQINGIKLDTNQLIKLFLP